MNQVREMKKVQPSTSGFTSEVSGDAVQLGIPAMLGSFVSRFIFGGGFKRLKIAPSFSRFRPSAPISEITSEVVCILIYIAGLLVLYVKGTS